MRGGHPCKEQSERNKEGCTRGGKGRSCRKRACMLRDSKEPAWPGRVLEHHVGSHKITQDTFKRPELILSAIGSLLKGFKGYSVDMI